MLFDLPDIDAIVAQALAEDLGVPVGSLADTDLALLGRDVTSSSVLGEDEWFTGRIVARQDCVVAGLPVAARVFEAFSQAADLFDAVECFPLVAEGARVTAGTAVAEVDGLAQAVLAAERTALDFLMVLSGIATETSGWVALAGDRLQILDTRKTLPGLRDLSKYAVRVGGGSNHRQGLWDMVLVKDNHVARAGGVTAAIGRARLHHPELVLEVEADSAEQAEEAVRAGADIVLLDNMADETLAEAVRICRVAADVRGRPVLLEVSGGVTRDRIPVLRLSDVDRVSASALTLAAPVDFGLDEGRA